LKLFVQVMPELDVEKTPYNPFDLTKVWPHGDYPLIEVGIMMELNRNPENDFAEVEQAAFSPSNIVPGIGFSPATRFSPNNPQSALNRCNFECRVSG